MMRKSKGGIGEDEGMFFFFLGVSDHISSGSGLSSFNLI